MTRKVSRRRDGRKGLARLVFVTGTDTGVGKTLVTALLLHHLRQRGCHALAMKPFCSGGTKDVDLLHRLQQGELSRREINPFYFAEPVAPLVAARRRRRRISAGDVLRRIRAVQRRCGCLLIEGAGGLMAPLGEKFLVADLIAALDCNVVIVARNKLGTINHVLLTAEALARCGLSRIKIALLECKRRDLAARTNAKVLAEWLSPMEVVGLPFLGARANTASAVKRNCKKIKKSLAQISDFASFCALFKRSGKKAVRKKAIDSWR